MKPFLSVIIPARNEAKRLPLTLVDVDLYLSGADFSYEIIVVDNNSTDATAEIVKSFSKIIKNLLLVHESRRGKGWAVKRGMLYGTGNWRLFTDADNSTSIDHFEKMLPYIKEYQVIIGSRDVKGSKLVPPQPWYRRFLGNIGNIIIQILLLPGFWDTQCGFKCFSEEAAERIFKISKIDQWGFDAEVLALAKHFGYKIKEIPVTWVNDFRSSVKLIAYLTTLWDVLMVRWWLWRKKYEK